MADYKHIPRITKERELTWIPLSLLALEYQKSKETVRLWIKSGFIVEIGFHVKRDVTGHYIIGVPNNEFAKFSHPSVVNHPTTI
jgi:hypothetical protein